MLMRRKIPWEVRSNLIKILLVVWVLLMFCILYHAALVYIVYNTTIITPPHIQSLTYSIYTVYTDTVYIPVPYNMILPVTGLMDMMKNMYEEGDENMKKVIGEAMLKSQRGERPEPPSMDMNSDF